MIELIHKYPILIKILLTVVTVSFVVTGGWILGKESPNDYTAKVNGQKIPIQTYEEAIARMEEFYRNIYQGSIPDILQNKLAEKALDALIEKEIILQEAEKQGLMVTDSELSDSIKENKSFAGPDGAFDMNRYNEILKMNGMNQSAYEKSLRNELTVEKFRRMVKDSVYVSESEVREAYKKQLAAQKKEFKEEDFKAQKENLWRMQTVLAQERLMNSFMAGLKKSYDIKINTAVVANKG